MLKPIDGLQQIQDRWRQFPGSAPGGSGATGLLPNDIQGWSNLQNANTEALGQLQGHPMDVRVGKPLGGLPESIADDPNSTFNTAKGPFGAFGGLKRAL